MLVHIWPDNSYAMPDELEEALSYKSDDYITKRVEVCDNCGDLIIPEYYGRLARCGCRTIRGYSS